jgi:heme exporter protein A
MLEAKSLACTRQRRALFAGLSFALGAGESLRVAGANGSGKTSLLRILCGLASPDAGEVRWRGEPIRELREDYARQLVYLGHAPAVKDDLTPAENLRIAARLAGLPAAAGSIRDALARFHVPEALVRRLSQGQKRRAALARLCLSRDAPLWLLDEPFTALDREGMEALKALVQAHLEGGGMVVYSTHQDAGMGATRVLELGKSGPDPDFPTC